MGKIKVIIFLLCFWSCKKTKLEGDLSFFVGTWEWKYTVKTLDVCEPFPYDSIITHSPAIDNYTYSITFEKKGKLTVKKNGEKEGKYRLVYKTKNEQANFTIYYFRLDNKKKKIVGFKRYNSRPAFIYNTYFPEGIVEEDGCQAIENVFEKVN